MALKLLETIVSTSAGDLSGLSTAALNATVNFHHLEFMVQLQKACSYAHHSEHYWLVMQQASSILSSRTSSMGEDIEEEESTCEVIVSHARETGRSWTNSAPALPPIDTDLPPANIVMAPSPASA